MHEELKLVHNPIDETVVLCWPSGPLNDMLADAVAATILQLQARHLGDGHATSRESQQQQKQQQQEKMHVKREVEGQPAVKATAFSSGCSMGEQRPDSGLRTTLVVRALGVAGPAPTRLAHPASNVKREVKEDVAEDIGGTDASEGPWELTACGQRAVLHVGETCKGTDDGSATVAPFDRLECEDVEARRRIERVIALAHGATVPIERPAV